MEKKWKKNMYRLKVGDKVYIKPDEGHAEWIIKLYDKQLMIIREDFHDKFILSGIIGNMFWSPNELCITHSILTEGYDIYGSKL